MAPLYPQAATIIRGSDTSTAFTQWINVGLEDPGADAWDIKVVVKDGDRTVGQVQLGNP
ncbi:hypothetical protein AB0B06_37445 [Streptomyces sp. NPDC044989]|uniref:hypothetical protein n=1 Tax=Streptomyces sp. NPDC044989 TaxID=3154336 RepID=UPI0033E16F1C